MSGRCYGLHRPCASKRFRPWSCHGPLATSQKGAPAAHFSNHQCLEFRPMLRLFCLKPAQLQLCDKHCRSVWTRHPHAAGLRKPPLRTQTRIWTRNLSRLLSPTTCSSSANASVTSNSLRSGDRIPPQLSSAWTRPQPPGQKRQPCAWRSREPPRCRSRAS